MGHEQDDAMVERIIWSLAVAAAGAIATAASTKGMELVWRRVRGHAPPHGVAGFAALGAGLGRRVARRFHL